MSERTIKRGERFRMESWSERRWQPMEKGAGGRRWRPRKTAIEAAAKCLAWTGFLGIPAMQVVDLSTGRVVWRFGDERYGFLSIGLPEAEEQLAHQLARRSLAHDEGMEQVRERERQDAQAREVVEQLGLGE